MRLSFELDPEMSGTPAILHIEPSLALRQINSFEIVTLGFVDVRQRASHRGL
jgi:hypothetical protein